MPNGIFIVDCPDLNFLNALKEGAEIRVAGDMLTTIANTNVRHQPYRHENYNFHDGLKNWHNFLRRLVATDSKGRLKMDLAGVYRPDGTEVTDLKSDIDEWGKSQAAEDVYLEKYMERCGIYVKFVIVPASSE